MVKKTVFTMTFVFFIFCAVLHAEGGFQSLSAEAQNYVRISEQRFAAEDFYGVKSTLDKAIETDPGSSYLYELRGDIKSMISDREGAIRDYNEAAELDEDNAGLYIKRARLKLSFSDYKGALKDSSTAIEKDRKNPGEATISAYLIKAETENLQGKKQQAFADIEKAFAVNPGNAGIYLSRGNLKMKNGDIAGAEEDYFKAIELNPALGEAYEKHDEALESLKKSDEKAYKEASEKEFSNPVSYLYRGYVKYRRLLYNEALYDVSTYVRMSPNNAQALAYRAALKYNTEDYKGAVEDYTKAIRITPSDSDLFYKRAVAKMRMEEYTPAILDLNEAIKRNPGNGKAYLARAAVKDERNLHRESKKDYDKAESMGINRGYFDIYKIDFKIK